MDISLFGDQMAGIIVSQYMASNTYITYLSQLDSDPHSPTCGQRLAFRRMIETPGPVLRFEEWDREGKAWRDAPPLLSIFGRGKTPNHITVAEEWAEREIVRAGGTIEDLII